MISQSSVFNARNRPRGPARSCRGTVLLTVTVVVMLISLAAFGFVNSMQTEHKAALATADQFHARASARSGIELVAALLEQPRQLREDLGGLQENPQQFRGRVVQADVDRERWGRFAIVAPCTDEIVDAPVRFGVEDEAIRLHLPTLLAWERERHGAARFALMNLPGMTETHADHLLDWIDADTASREFGAERYPNKGLQDGHGPANRLPCCLEELLQIPGFTAARLLGTDHNRNYRDDDLSSRGPAVTPSVPAWSRFLTLYSAERNQSVDGAARIFVNQPDLGMLHQQLAAALTPAIASFTVAYRQYGPASGTVVSGTDPIDFSVDLTVPARYRIASLLDLVEASVTVSSEQAEKRRTLRSPLNSLSSGLYESIAEWVDRCTTSPADRLAGRINLAAAPREVLLGIPELDATLADRILAARQTQSTSTATHKSVVWLWTDGLVDLPQMKRLLPRLTMHSDVVRFQTIGFVDDQSPTSRMEVVLDGSHTPARIVYLVDLQRRGRGFDLQLLGGELPIEVQAAAAPD